MPHKDPEAAKAYARKRHAENPEPRRESQRKYREAHASRLRQEGRDRKIIKDNADREAARAAQRAWCASNPVKAKASSEKRRLKRYGLTVESINAMLASQGHACPICDKALSYPSRNTHVDHCHETGMVRSLLCGSCNPMIGYAQEDSRILQKAVQYLERFRRKQ